MGLPAGPSESIVLADESADPELVARDLLVEAEHGPDSSSLLVTNSRTLLEAVLSLLPDKIKALPEPRQTFCRSGFESEQGTGGLLLTENTIRQLTLSMNMLQNISRSMFAKPFALLADLKNAGEILIGPYTPIPMGNYCLGDECDST